MPKLYDDIVFDAALGVFTTAATATQLKMVYCSQEPADRTEASTLFDGTTGKYRTTDEIDLAPADIPIADRVAGGREITVAAKSANGAATVAAGGDKWVAIYNATVLLAKTDDTADLAVDTGQPINIPSFKLAITDPP